MAVQHEVQALENTFFVEKSKHVALQTEIATLVEDLKSKQEGKVHFNVKGRLEGCVTLTEVETRSGGDARGELLAMGDVRWWIRTTELGRTQDDQRDVCERLNKRIEENKERIQGLEQDVS